MAEYPAPQPGTGTPPSLQMGTLSCVNMLLPQTGNAVSGVCPSTVHACPRASRLKQPGMTANKTPNSFLKGIIQLYSRRREQARRCVVAKFLEPRRSPSGTRFSGIGNQTRNLILQIYENQQIEVVAHISSISCTLNP